MNIKDRITHVGEEITEKTPADLWEEDLKALYGKLSTSYTNFPASRKYTGIDFINSKNSYENTAENVSSKEDFIDAMIGMTDDLGDDNTFVVDPFYYDYFLALDGNEGPIDRFFKERDSEIKAKSLPEIRNAENNSIELSTPVDNTALIRIYSFDEDLIESDGEKIRDFLSNLGRVDQLIIDIRGNRGFSVNYVVENILKPLADDYYSMEGEYLVRQEDSEPFIGAVDKYIEFGDEIGPIKEIGKKYGLSGEDLKPFKGYRKFSLNITPDENIGFNGRIYILQDTDTIRAADFLSQFANRTGFATTCGTYTGGYGLDFLPGFYRLPNTDYIIAYSARCGLNEDGSFNSDRGTYPVMRLKEQDMLNNLIDMIH